ncbi:uncharacterized protein TRAVEDRAFT_75304, partial [Trametes versicolor FP-101664 SS1]|uniref:uncharacterized protein n=1 Tax=Trametes versicolor (strain FP-101664) TaxID=717944 RepID=UPI0004624493
SPCHATLQAQPSALVDIWLSPAIYLPTADWHSATQSEAIARSSPCICSSARTWGGRLSLVRETHAFAAVPLVHVVSRPAVLVYNTLFPPLLETTYVLRWLHDATSLTVVGEAFIGEIRYFLRGSIANSTASSAGDVHLQRGVPIDTSTTITHTPT